MSDAEDLVRRVMEAHNRGADAIVDAFDDLFSPDFEWTPMTVGAYGRATYRGREGMERYYRERAEVFVYWCRDGRLVRGKAFRSTGDALEAARA